MNMQCRFLKKVDVVAAEKTLQNLEKLARTLIEDSNENDLLARRIYQVNPLGDQIRAHKDIYDDAIDCFTQKSAEWLYQTFCDEEILESELRDLGWPKYRSRNSTVFSSQDQEDDQAVVQRNSRIMGRWIEEMHGMFNIALRGLKASLRSDTEVKIPNAPTIAPSDNDLFFVGDFFYSVSKQRFYHRNGRPLVDAETEKGWKVDKQEAKLLCYMYKKTKVNDAFSMSREEIAEYLSVSLKTVSNFPCRINRKADREIIAPPGKRNKCHILGIDTSH